MLFEIKKAYKFKYSLVYIFNQNYSIFYYFNIERYSFSRHRLCKIHNYEKYDYLVNFDSHPLIPSKSTSTSPIFNLQGI